MSDARSINLRCPSPRLSHGSPTARGRVALVELVGSGCIPRAAVPVKRRGRVRGHVAEPQLNAAAYSLATYGNFATPVLALRARRSARGDSVASFVRGRSAWGWRREPPRLHRTPVYLSQAADIRELAREGARNLDFFRVALVVLRVWPTPRLEAGAEFAGCGRSVRARSSRSVNAHATCSGFRVDAN